jgi:hypothetical protein
MRVPIRPLLIAAAILPIHGQTAKALLLWDWSYSGAGVSASGNFTTKLCYVFQNRSSATRL